MLATTTLGRHTAAMLLRLLLWPFLLPFTLLRYALWRFSKKNEVLRVNLEGHHAVRAGGSFFERMRPALPRRALRRALRAAVRDRQIRKVQVAIGHLEGGDATVYELRELLREARAGGLEVEAHLAWVDTRTLWLASACSRVHLTPGSLVLATGVAAELTFFGEVLGRAGVEVEVIAAGTYKSFMETFTRTGPTEANREAIDALLDDRFAGLVADLAAGRGLDEAAVRAIFDGGPYTAEEAVALGLADAVTDPEAFFDEEALPAWGYQGTPRPWPRWPRRAKLALIEVTGTIRDGSFEDPDPQGAVPQAVVGCLDAARKSKRIRGVLLHIDSPGGSAAASERMWQAVRKLAAEKPVVVWMADVAASGGYYLAAGAQTIVAAPGTLTGSIGVIMARPVIAGLLARLGLHRVRFERGAHSGLLSPSRPLQEAERSALERHIQAAYQMFLDRVTTGRGRDDAWLRPIAEGRVWTGRQALAHGLVDQLGTEADALSLLAQKVGLDPQVREVRLIRARRSLLGRLRPLVVGPRIEALEVLRLAEEAPVLAWCPVRLQ